MTECKKTKLINDPKDLMGLVSKDKLRSFFKVSTTKGLASILFEWIMIVVAAYFCEKYFYWPTYVLAVVFIGARLLALGLLMHEAVHNLISKNKTLNDIIAELFCAWPLFISLRSYRIKHLAHHRWLNTDLDPDYVAKTDDNWRFPMKVSKFVKMLMIQLSGFGVFETFKVMSGKQVKTKKEKTPTWYHVARISFYLVVFSSFIGLGYGMILLKYWIVPFATWTQFANRLRRVAEHSGIEDKELPFQTRTTKHGFLVRLFLVPKNIAYHSEHHLYPGVPCYNLPKIHKELLKHAEVKQSFYISKNYVSVIKDCVKLNKNLNAK